VPSRFAPFCGGGTGRESAARSQEEAHSQEEE